jgi:hypothetical protein
MKRYLPTKELNRKLGTCQKQKRNELTGEMEKCGGDFYVLSTRSEPGRTERTRICKCQSCFEISHRTF